MLAIDIGETGHMIEECTRKHQRYLWLYHLECSVVVECSIN
jgi:hypothetical protein